MAFYSARRWREEERKLKIMTGAARSGDGVNLIRLRHGITRYQLDPEDDRPLLIGIHGWSTSSYVWEPLRSDLRGKGYRLLTYDLYGRGMSDRPDLPHTAALFVDQLSELLSRLGLNGVSTSVLGYSMGGAIAARFVSQRLRTIERLLLIAPAGMGVTKPGPRFIARSFPRTLDPHAKLLLHKGLPRAFEEQAGRFIRDPAVARVVDYQKNELKYRGYIPSLVSSLKGILAHKMEKEHQLIAQAGLPVKAIFAAEDDTIPTWRARWLFDRWNPKATSRSIEGAGHGVTYTQPERVMVAVGTFL